MTPTKQWRGMLAADIVDELFARIEALEAKLIETKRIADNASIDARWPTGNFGGHGF